MPQSKALIQWQAYEFKPRVISRSFYVWIGIFLLAVIIYALVSNSPVMAITFILIGIMGYITLEQDPALLNCTVTKSGIIVGRELYDFETIESFWVQYEEHEQYISIKTNGALTPFTHIPLGDENPVTIRDILSQYIPEERHDKTFIDIIEKILHIK